MSWTFDGTGDLLTRGLPLPADSMPLWMSAWVRLSVLGTSRTVLSIVDESAAFNEDHQILVTAANKASASTNNSGTSGGALSTGTLSVDTWHHIAGIFKGGSSRTVWLDGTDSGTNTTATGAPTGLDLVSAGALDYSIVALQLWNGELAELAIGSGVLNDSDVKLLAAGFSPHFLPRHVELRAYWPLFDNNDLNDYGPDRQFTFTAEADAAYDTAHPPIVRRIVADEVPEYARDYVPMRQSYYERRRRVG